MPVIVTVRGEYQVAPPKQPDAMTTTAPLPINLVYDPDVGPSDPVRWKALSILQMERLIRDAHPPGGELAFQHNPCAHAFVHMVAENALLQTDRLGRVLRIAMAKFKSEGYLRHDALHCVGTLQVWLEDQGANDRVITDVMRAVHPGRMAFLRPSLSPQQKRYLEALAQKAKGRVARRPPLGSV